MENERSTEIDSLQPTSLTSTSSLTITSNSGTSPSNQINPQKFFHTIKKTNRNNIERKKKLFETTNNSNQLYSLENPELCINKQPNQLIETFPKFKETYIELLINSLDNQLKTGIITLDYLNSPTLPKLSDYSIESDEEVFKKKCENKMCAVIVDSPKDIYQAKFTTISSYRAHIQWLCKNCYSAFQLGNYCYYCNIIYREFEFNQQYYDSKKWIQCDYCSNWQHVLCEENTGKFESLEELAMNSNFKYKCPICRKESEHKHKEYMISEKSKLFILFIFILYNNFYI
jgi:hypothetical protein